MHQTQLIKNPSLLGRGFFKRDMSGGDIPYFLLTNSFSHPLTLKATSIRSTSHKKTHQKMGFFMAGSTGVEPAVFSVTS
jgi:hypothetical protein